VHLLYQLKVKLLAEKAGLSSINPEGNQFVLRFPDGTLPWPLPDLGPAVRVGKAALWMSLENLDDWQRELLEVLERLGGRTTDNGRRELTPAVNLRRQTTKDKRRTTNDG